jgi:hypothetical protein
MSSVHVSGHIPLWVYYSFRAKLLIVVNRAVPLFIIKTVISTGCVTQTISLLFHSRKDQIPNWPSRCANFPNFMIGS